MHLSFSRILILPSSSHTNLNLSHLESFLRAAGVSGHGLSVAIQEVRSWKREFISAENCCLLLFTHLSLSLSLWGLAPCRLTHLYPYMNLLALDGCWSSLSLLITMNSMFANAKCYVSGCWCTMKTIVKSPTNSQWQCTYIQLDFIVHPTHQTSKIFAYPN